MKIKNSIYIMLLLSLTVSMKAVAQESSNLKVSYIEGKGKKFAVVVKNANGENMQLSLTDINKTKLMEVAYSTDAVIARQINVNELPEGIYSLNVIDSDEIVSVPIKVSFTKAFVLTEQKRTILKPAIQHQGRSVLLRVKEEGSNPNRVLIYDDAGILIHSQRISGSLPLQQIFNFSKVEGDTYKFELVYSDNNFSELITLN